VVLASTKTFSGPLPPPEAFEKYDLIVPGAAERILTIAESEQRHRHGWEDNHLRWDGITNIVALTFGWLLSLLLAGGAIYCATIHEPWVAGALTGFAAFGAVAHILNARRMFTKKDHAIVPAKAPTNPTKKPVPQKKKRRR